MITLILLILMINLPDWNVKYIFVLYFDKLYDICYQIFHKNCIAFEIEIWTQIQKK